MAKQSIAIVVREIVVRRFMFVLPVIAYGKTSDRRNGGKADLWNAILVRDSLTLSIYRREGPAAAKCFGTGCLFRKPVFDFGVRRGLTGLAIGQPRASRHALESGELSRATGDVANVDRDALAGRILLTESRAADEELVAIFEDIRGVVGARSIVAPEVGHATGPNLLELDSIYHRRVGREGAVNFVRPHLMARHVSSVDP